MFRRKGRLRDDEPVALFGGRYKLRTYDEQKNAFIFKLPGTRFAWGDLARLDPEGITAISRVVEHSDTPG
jgi:hypothetical protein